MLTMIPFVLFPQASQPSMIFLKNVSELVTVKSLFTWARLQTGLGPVSEISPCLFRCVHMKGRAGSVPKDLGN